MWSVVDTYIKVETGKQFEEEENEQENNFFNVSCYDGYGYVCWMF